MLQDNFALALSNIVNDARVYKTYDTDQGLDPAKNYMHAYCFSHKKY